MPPVQDKGPARLEDYLFAFPNGMDSGRAPILLPLETLAFSTNGTVRGDFFTNRPSFKTQALVFDKPATQAVFEQGLWQGATYYLPALGAAEQLVAAVSGHLLLFTPGAGVTVSVTDVTPTDSPTLANVTQAWLWQAENYVIWNDGISNPVFFDGVASRHSNFSAKLPFSTTVSANFVIPAVGATVIATVGDTSNMVAGDIVTLQNGGQLGVQSVTNPTTVVLVNMSCLAGNTAVSGRKVNWFHLGQELPPGRMGAYVLGRNWESLVDGQQFLASDLVGGSSGTQANNFKDSVLNIVENTYLAGGGNFSVPGGYGVITAMVGIPTLDASLGQGPVLVVTAKGAFSCLSPTDRTQWTAVTNPILTAAMLVNAGLGQYSTVPANSDILMRAVDGLRSLILTRNDFKAWGNVAISHEMSRVLRLDNRALLAFSTAGVFDNRLLLGCAPTASPQGVYHKGVIALNFDPQTSLKTSQTPVYDGLWVNLNPLQILVGSFSGVERCFAFTYNSDLAKLQLREVLVDEGSTFDDNGTPIPMSFESAVLFREQDPRKRIFKGLWNGEIYVDQLIGIVNFTVYYRPEGWPGWVRWHSWTECQQAPSGIPGTVNYQPGFRPRMGLGTPSASDCDPCTNKPLREAFNFQFKVSIVGACVFKGARFEAVEVPKPVFAPKACDTICS